MMQTTNTVKRILSMIMVVMIIMTLMPIHAHAAETNNVVDSVVFFSDLHTSKSNSKASLVTNIFRSIATNSATKVSAVFSVGDVFSSNDSANNGNLSTITNAIRDGLQDSSVHVDYTWSDHDRYGGIENYTGLAYGAGADGIYGNADDDNYYVYFISMSDMTTSPRYGTTSTFSSSKLADFTNAVATLDHSKPLFIASHMPLLDNRGDNGHAYKWFQVISAAAETMDKDALAPMYNQVLDCISCQDSRPMDLGAPTQFCLLTLPQITETHRFWSWQQLQRSSHRSLSP